jgi:hypothetical protein
MYPSSSLRLVNPRLLLFVLDSISIRDCQPPSASVKWKVYAFSLEPLAVDKLKPMYCRGPERLQCCA